MNNTLKNRAVNWTDGMKVSKEHLVQTDQYIDERIKDTIYVGQSRSTYGLLKDSAGFSLTLNEIDTALEIIGSLTHCSGITKGGYRIEIPWGENDTQSPLRLQKKLTTIGDYYVIVRVEDERIPTGEVTRESPSRLCDVVPKYSFDVLTKELIASDDRCLPISKIYYTKSVFGKDENYIPPCVRIGSSEKLLNIATNMVDTLIGTISNAAKLTSQADRNKRETQLIMRLSEVVAKTITTSIDSIAWLLYEQAPVRLFEIGVSYVRSINLFLSCLSNEEKSDLFKAMQNRIEFHSDEFQEIERRVLIQPRTFVQYDLELHLDPIIKYVNFMSRMILNLLTSKREPTIYIGE